MADGILTVSLDNPLADEIRAAAAARGVSPEDYVREQLADRLGSKTDDLSWEEDLRRLKEPGEDVDAEVVFSELRDQVEKARRTKP